jgi:transcriptional regulator with XRE-family HTH domain
MPERPGSLPLAELVAERRARLSLSLAAVARGMRQAAEQEGNKHCGASRQTVHEIERGRRIPHPDTLRWLSVALELPTERVAEAAREQRMNRRQLLQGAGLAGFSLLLGRQTPGQVGEITGYLRRVFPEFSTADWLLGSQLVLPTVPRHLEVIEQLAASATGPARVELLDVGARWAEFAAWLYQDAGNDRLAAWWADRALGWAEEAGNRVMVAYVLARKANQAADRHDAGATIGLAQAAQREPLPARVRGVALLQQAHGCALAGDEPGCFHALDVAAELAHGDEGPGRYLTPGYVEIERATCSLLLGRPDRAVIVLQRELASLPAVHRRDRGVYLARLAAAYTASGDRDASTRVATEARTIAEATGSRRILGELPV